LILKSLIAEPDERIGRRLKFFQDRLYYNYNASQSSGRQNVCETYPKFIPPKPEDEKPRLSIGTTGGAFPRLR
jgi:hypothetical protein